MRPRWSVNNIKSRYFNDAQLFIYVYLFLNNLGCQLSDKHMTQQNTRPFLHNCCISLNWSWSYSHSVQVWNVQLSDSISFSVWCVFINLSNLYTQSCGVSTSLLFMPMLLAKNMSEAVTGQKKEPHLHNKTWISSSVLTLLAFCSQWYLASLALLPTAAHGWSCEEEGPEIAQPCPASASPRQGRAWRCGRFL